MDGARGGALYRGPALEWAEDEPTNAVGALISAAQRSPHAGVITLAADGSAHRRDYPQLLDQARRMLTGLRERGLRSGTDIVLCGLPLADFFPAFWACVLGGARPVFIAERPEAGSPTLERLWHTCELLGDPLVVTGRADAVALETAAPRLRTVVAEDCPRHPPARDHVEPAGSDMALLMLSSGSTGEPKAVRLTHEGLAEFAASSRRILDVRPDDTTVNWLPVDHSGAFLLYHLLEVFVGCTNVHAPTGYVLTEPLRWLDLLEEYGASHSWAPTFAYRLITDALDEHPARTWDVSSTRTLVCGGEQIPLTVMKGFLTATARFGVREEHIIPVWGMAETVTAITYGRLGSPGSVHHLRKDSLDGPLVRADEDTGERDRVSFVSVGTPAHHTDVRVLGPRGEPLPEDRIGRLQVRSPARVTPGYVRNAEADRAAFPAGDQWLDTGDLAFLAGGQVTITGRSKDLIILNGHNVYCHEVEEAATTVPGVRSGQIAACGVPDRETGSESLVLFFVGDARAEEEERIGGRIKAAVYRGMRLTVARTVPVPEAEFPRTPAGKVRRAELRDRLLAGAFDPPAAHEVEADDLAATDSLDATAAVGSFDRAAEMSEVVREAVAALVEGEVAPEAPFYELGLTSLHLTRLRGRLEQHLGRSVPQTAFFEHPTVSALATYLSAEPPQGAPSTPPPSTTHTPPEPEPVGHGVAEPAERRIAIIGMSARFPGASSVDAFWTNLRQGTDNVSVFAQRDDDPAHVPVGGVLEDVEGFDAKFFGVSPKEAGLTDPAHRLFLECCHEAMEEGGYSGTVDGGRVAVFAGAGMNLYDHQTSSAGTPPLTDDDPATGLLTATGRQPDFLASRVAYRLGLTGPAIGVQTACSTSLVAVHLAARALLSGDAELALAGAAAVHTPQDSGYRGHTGSILSPTGRCRAFDEDADGTVGGNGVAAVLLKPLDRALADGDTVHAVLLGSAVNNDGAGKVGFSAPGLAGQVEVVRQALGNANVPPKTVTYVEAHGTGTQLGDPVEFEALSRAFKEGTDRTGFCTLGSVKPAIGHLDSCAGMAGLIKTVLMLKHRTLIPTLHLRRANPALALEDSPFVLGTTLRPWTTPAGVPLRAGVSALGVGGTNAHVVLEEAPSSRERDRRDPLRQGPNRQDLPRYGPSRSARPVLVPVSTRTADVLPELVDRVRAHLLEQPDLAASDVATTLALGRPHREHRAAVVGRTADELAQALGRVALDGPKLGNPAFAYPGQGSTRAGMAREIYDAHPEARRVVDLCERLYAQEFGGTLLPLLLGDGAGLPEDPKDAVWPTDIAQPALFAHQMALTQLWRTMGIRPALLLGHSVGEYAALCAAGALSLEDGLRITARRGRLMQRLCRPGGMLAVRANAEVARRVAEAAGADLAAVNGPRSQVISGSTNALREAERLLDKEGVRSRLLAVDRAFHSTELVPALAELRTFALQLDLRASRVPLVSGLDGEVRPVGWRVDAAYLLRQAREPVRFDLAMATAVGEGCADFLEIGGAEVLAGLGKHCAPTSRWLPGQGAEGDEWAGALTSLAEFYRCGAEIDWAQVSGRGGRVPLPGHPLRKRPFPVVVDAATGTVRPSHPPAPEEAASTGSTDTGGTALTEIVESVRELTSLKLGVELADVGADTSFFALGADSLSLMGMTAELRRRHEVHVPVRELFADCDTPRKLAELVVRLGGGSREQAASPSEPLDASVERGIAEGPAQPGQLPGVSSEATPAEATPHEATPAEATPAETAPREVESDAGLRDLVAQQLQVTGQLVDQVTGLMSRQLEMLAGASPAPTAADVQPPNTTHRAVPHVPRTPVPQPPAVRTPVPAPPVRPVASNASTARSASAPAGSTRETSPVVEADQHAEVSQGDSASCDFSLYFFGDYPDTSALDPYELMLRAAEFADTHGFHALWFPERHFNSFGAPFPNPSVLAAALAARTSQVRLHAGSVVLPLHHPVRVAEEWSVVDNLSGGRVGLCVASGWSAKDFTLAPENFGRHREVMYEGLETVRALWSGQSLTMAGGDGAPVEIQLHPRPVQDQPPLYVAVVSNPDSYRRAAVEGLGVVTNLMSQSVEQLAKNIALYRRTRAEHGLDPAKGRVVVLVHTYLGADAETARAEAYQPFISYLRSSLSLFDQVTNSLGFEVDLDNTPEEDVDFLLGRAYESYCATRALIGDQESVRGTVRELTRAGADEIACFVDFGVPADKVLAGLPAIDDLRAHTQGPSPGDAPTPVAAAASPPPKGASGPLTPAQRRIWLVEQMYPGTNMYHEPKAIRLEGQLDHDRLTWALRRTVERQPALRTVFAAADGVPHHRPGTGVAPECPVEDHTGATEEQALRSVLDGEGRRVFDLAEGPLFSCRLLRLADERHLLFLLAHHIIFDSSSTAVFTRELAAHYRSWPHPPDLPDVAPRPVAVLDHDRTAEALAFWRRELADAPELTLPSDRSRPPVRTGAGASLTHQLDAELTARLREFAGQRRATLFMVLTAAVGAVLGRFSGQRDIVVGTAVAARPEGADGEVGLFLDTVALRLDLAGDPHFTELLGRVKDRSTAAYEHRDVPFDEVVSALNPRRDPSRNPLFQVMVEYENEGEVEFDPPRVRATLLDTPSERAPFDLSFYLTHSRAGLRFMAEYDTDLFVESDVRRLVEYVEHVLRGALVAPEAPLSALTTLTDADRAQVARLGRHTEQPTTATGTLHGLCAAQARRTPDAVALLTDTEQVTYEELDRRAARLARWLRTRGVGHGDRVAVLLPRGPELITALLGVMRGGAAYLPIDVSAPTARVERLLTDGAPALALTTRELLAQHPVLERWQAWTPEQIDDDAPEDEAGTEAATPDAQARDIGPDDPAYCLYTSGSTGSPKGVVVPHRGPVNLVLGHLERHPNLRTLQWTSPAFDVSVQEIFTTLASGATLVLVDEETRQDPVALAEAVRRHGVRRMYMPCTPLKYLLETGPSLPTLRELFSAGEALELTPAFLDFLAAHPECALYNQYGPTETSIVVTSHRVDPREGARPPIGQPLPGVRIHLVDEAGREVPLGAVGEIQVSGTAVSHGYHGRPEETEAAFVRTATGEAAYRTGDRARWREDGTLAYLGRLDDQVKVRGHRVEPAEVQQALTRQPGVRDAAVLPHRDVHGETELVAYVTGPEHGGPEGAHERLRAALATELPDHLVPRHWVCLERLPVNAAGKLDRDQLPTPRALAADPSGADEEPADGLERNLHDLWCAELGLDRLPVTRSFFALGGHSLTAVRLLTRMATEHGLTLSMAEFFRAPTVRAVAGRLRPRPQAPTETVAMPATLRRLWHRHHERADPSVYHVAHRVDLRGELIPRALTRALESLVERHGALRGQTVRRDGELLVEILPEVPVDVPISDLTALDSAEVDAWCQEGAARPLAMDRAPLFRFQLGRRDGESWVLLVVLHHAICDGWSMGVLWHELETLYTSHTRQSPPSADVPPPSAALPPPSAALPPPSAQFTDYVRWEWQQLRGERRDQLEAFWQAELESVPLHLELPADHPRGRKLSGEGALHQRVVDGAVPGQVVEIATELGTTPYTVLAAAFATWAARLRGDGGDVVFAASSANRAGFPELAGVVGLVGDSVPLRARVSEADTFADLVARVGTALFDALDHQALTANEIVRLLAPRDADGPYPKVLFTVVTTPPPALHLDGVTATVRGLPLTGVARNELYVVLVPGPERITVTFEYSTDLFEEATVERWAEEFARLLATVTSRPQTSLPALLEGDRT